MTKDNYVFRAIKEDFNKLEYIEFFGYMLPNKEKQARLKQLQDKYPFDTILVMKLIKGLGAKRS